MKVFREKKSGMTVDRVCFYKGEKVRSSAQLVRYYRCPMEYDAMFSGPFFSKDYNYTLLNDLSKSEDDLFAGFKSNYRNEIRRSAKEDYKIDWISADALAQGSPHLDAFEKLHEKMLVDKDMADLTQNYDHNQIVSFIEQGCFILTRAEAPDSGVVYHGYLCDGDTAILQHSCSDFRDGTVNRTSSGRLNKLLHWEDMKRFKALGFQAYDWGNTFDEGPDYTNGIDKFKAGFGGRSIRLVSAFKGNTFTGVLATIVRTIKMRHR